MIAVVLRILLCGSVSASQSCVLKSYSATNDNMVCVCNSTYCDQLEHNAEIPFGKAVLYTSSIDGKRFESSLVPIEGGSSKRGAFLADAEDQCAGLVLSHSLWAFQSDSVLIKLKVCVNEAYNQELTGNITITIDAGRTYQSIIGFGGAFTDSVGINLNSLSRGTRANLLSSYFGKNGIEYNIARVPIASTDFSTREYSYADTANDFEMKLFALAEEDFKFKIPHIVSAINLTDGELLLFATPWSAPGWMKTNGRMKGGAPLRGEVNGKYYHSYAIYLVRFFEHYAENDILFWGLTLQNEPTSGAFPFYWWQTMFFTAEMQRDFVKSTLGPMFKTNNATKNLKLIALDDNRLFLPQWADIVYDDPESSKYINGIGVHWYMNLLTKPSVLSLTHSRHPEKFLLATEACAGSFLVRGPIMGDWHRAEDYASDIVADLNNFVAGWTDWNICLDQQGGPSWAKNYVDSPIIVNASADEFYKQPMFYAMGHFSKFFKRGSVRVGVEQNSSYDLPVTAAIFKDDISTELYTPHRTLRYLHHPQDFTEQFRMPNTIGVFGPHGVQKSAEGSFLVKPSDLAISV